MGRSLAFCVLLAVGVGGCDRSSKALERAEKSIESWEATMGLVGEELAAGRVPRVYVGQVTKAARESLDEVEKQLRKGEAGNGRRRGLVARLGRLRERVGEFSNAAGGGA
jgi:hypothetical protein